MLLRLPLSSLEFPRFPKEFPNDQNYFNISSSNIVTTAATTGAANINAKSQVDTQCSLDYIVVSLNFPLNSSSYIFSSLFTFCRYLMELQLQLQQPQLLQEFSDIVVGYFL